MKSLLLSPGLISLFRLIVFFYLVEIPTKTMAQ